MAAYSFENTYAKLFQLIIIFLLFTQRRDVRTSTSHLLFTEQGLFRDIVYVLFVISTLQRQQQPLQSRSKYSVKVLKVEDEEEVDWRGIIFIRFSTTRLYYHYYLVHSYR